MPLVSETTFAQDKYQKKPSRLIMKRPNSVCFLSVYITFCSGFLALIFVLLCSLKYFSILQKKMKRRNMGNCYAIETADCNLRKKRKKKPQCTDNIDYIMLMLMGFIDYN